MSCRFQNYVDNLDGFNREHYQTILDAWDPAKLSKANELAKKLDNAGCIESEAWVFSEIDENIAQSARFIFLKNLWEKVINPAPTLGVENLRVSDEKCASTLEKLDAVLSSEEKEHLFKEFAIQMGWDFVQAIDEGYSYENDELPSWVLMEVDVNTDQLTGRDIGGLHESFMDEDYSGKSI